METIKVKRTRRSSNEFLPDTGCKVSPSCFTCPLPRCKFEDGAGYLQYVRILAARSMVKTMEKEGLTVPQAAAKAGIVLRVAYRYKKLVADGATSSFEQWEDRGKK